MAYVHYDLTRQERQQLNAGSWYGCSAPLCATGDGHYRGTNPAQWGRPDAAPLVTCPKCLELLETHARTLGPDVVALYEASLAYSNERN